LNRIGGGVCAIEGRIQCVETLFQPHARNRS
jgi:hypothetical protein